MPPSFTLLSKSTSIVFWIHLKFSQIRISLSKSQFKQFKGISDYSLSFTQIALNSFFCADSYQIILIEAKLVWLFFLSYPKMGGNVKALAFTCHLNVLNVFQWYFLPWSSIRLFYWTYISPFNYWIRSFYKQYLIYGRDVNT